MELTITFLPTGIRIGCPEGSTVLEAARMSPLDVALTLDSPCGGHGKCGKCLVKVVDGTASIPGEVERRLLSADQLRAGYRLACSMVPRTSASLEIESAHLEGGNFSPVSTPDPDVKLNPPIRQIELTVPMGNNSREFAAMRDWLAGELEGSHDVCETVVDPDALGSMERFAAESSVVATMRDDEIIDVCPASMRSRPLGVAVDLGTTKIAGYLVDLSSGSVLAAAGTMNPQLPFGGDVMSRLAHAVNDSGSAVTLRRVVVEGIDELVRRLTDRAGEARGHVAEMVVAANTAMSHLLLGLPVARLARAPFEPAVSEPILAKARDLGLHLAPGAYVYVLPPIGGFVGGDHVAMILATRLREAGPPVLGLDIGTNTEIVLAGNGRLLCCSCASGPAFEGGHLSCGMRAVDGALAGLRLGNAGGVAGFQTIGGGRPVGICGSGALDAVSEMVRLGIIDQNGLFDRSHDHVRANGADGMASFLLFPGQESGSGRDVEITEQDVSELQLAKAAVAAGIELVLLEEGLRPEELSKVLVAGAFGSHLDPASAVSVGMIPDIPLDRIQQVGNAAGTGAVHALISMVERGVAENVAREAKHLELSSHPAFSRIFARELRFATSREA